MPQEITNRRRRTSRRPWARPVVRPVAAGAALVLGTLAISPSPAAANAATCAGLTSPLTRVGNTVFTDTNDNAVFDATETGIDGVTVELWLDADDDGVFEPTGDDGATATCTTTTSGGGHYWFYDVDPDQYFVAIASAPTGHRSSTDTTTAAATDHVDDGAPMAGYASVTAAFDLTVALPTGELAPDAVTDDEAAAETATAPATYGDTFSDLTIDLGFAPIPCLGIGNRVWHDSDADGVFDSGELGIDGVTVELFASDAAGTPTGTVLETAMTSNGGYYLFACRDEGSYVVVIPASNFSDGATLQGLESSPNGTPGTDQEDDGIDPTTAGDRVLGPLVTLTDGAQPAGEADKPSGTAWSFDSPSDEANDTTIDFGFADIPDPATAALGDYVWVDANEDGVQNPGEVAVGGVTLVLLDEIGDEIAFTTTDTDGFYHFGGLEGGTYTVCYLLSTLPSGMVGTTTNSGADDLVDSDFGTTNCTEAINLDAGVVIPTLDLGLTESHVDLAVTKAGSWSATDKEISWSIVVRNVGTEADPGSIIITDILPTGLGTPAITAPTGVSCNYNTTTRQITCTSSSPLPGGSSLAIGVVTPQTSGSACSISNTVTVRGAGVDATSANNVASATVSNVCTPTTPTTPTLPKTGGTVLLVSLAAMLTTTGHTLTRKARR